MKIDIKPTDRASFIGTTGSGKSYLAMSLLAPVRRLVVLNSGADPEMQGKWGLTPYGKAGMRRLLRGESARLIVNMPDGKNRLRTAGERHLFWETILDQLMDLRDVHIEIDELYAVGPAAGSEGVRNLYTLGRKFNISTFGATQRPRRIPLFVLSEAEHTFTGRLNVEADREYMAEIAGLQRTDRRKPLVPRFPKDAHKFLFSSPNLDDPVIVSWKDGHGLVIET